LGFLFLIFGSCLLTYTICYRILYRMKVTAIIADDLIDCVKECTQSYTVTEAINTALKEWVSMYKIKELNNKIIQNPINIKNGHRIREINRST